MTKLQRWFILLMLMTRLSKIIFTIIILLIATAPIFADSFGNWNFYVGIDGAYYPESDTLTGNTKNHFAPITGLYKKVEARTIAHADYTIAIPLGQNWLLNSANVILGTALELSPLSVKPQLSVTFTPVPFLVLSGGIQGGTGWDLGSLTGAMCFYDEVNQKYLPSTPFKNYFYKWWVQGTFQFDTGALIPGDWTHVVMQYSYQIYYEGLTGAAPQAIWKWQGIGNRVNGLHNYQCGILAYQMPLKLYRAGVMFESDGFYNNSDFYNTSYNGSFKQISIGPVAQIKFDEHNLLSVIAGFSSRRCYTQKLADGVSEASTGFYASREWFFNRVAFSYTHTF